VTTAVFELVRRSMSAEALEKSRPVVTDQACPNYGLPLAKCSAAPPLAVRKGFAFPAPGNPPNPVFLGREGSAFAPKENLNERVFAPGKP